MPVRMMELAAVTGLGGLIFALLHVPLSWFLGPLAAGALWSALTKRKLHCPVQLRNAGIIVMGYLLGQSMTKEAAVEILFQFPTMFLANLLTIGFSLWMGYWISKKTRISLASGILGSVPGGLFHMTVLSEEIRGTDLTVVTFMHTIRLLCAIFIVPFVAAHGLASGTEGSNAINTGSHMGWTEQPWISLLGILLPLLGAWLAVKLRFPTPFMIGPILLMGVFGASGISFPELPYGVVLAGQWAVGAYMGLDIRLNRLANWKNMLVYALLNGIGLVLFSLAMAFFISLLHPDVTLLTSFLSTSPGGVTEMGIAAAEIGGEVSMVVAYQMFRILFILFLVTPLMKWWFLRTASPSVH